MVRTEPFRSSLCEVGTYAGKDWSGRAMVPEREQTLGGYTNLMVVQERPERLVLCPSKWPFHMDSSHYI